ncbi:ferric reduction oxidase 4-like isoform X1 [Pistacia vera]|uniref:ferric reduction oxidase 4-like isoform X1 n=2 Tax=Pistacia vera TaxID=55513 RepID=UPI00126395F7|nr:ferric reduction oxidase 4-like isoform X1 [Pistacia vera]
MGSRTLPLNTICFVVFLAWLLVWVLLPTKIYKQTWTPKLNSNLNSTYFGEKGTNLLLFSFPIMLIAVLGCVYLHLQKKRRLNPNSEMKCNCVTFSRRPVLVMAPLGIVTALELTFVVMFIALMIWSLGNYLYVSFGHLHMHKAGEKVWQAKFRSVSLRLGYIGNTCWAFLFFPVTRASSILPLVRLTSESSIKYHIWLGHLSNLLFVAHTVGFIIYWAMTDQMIELLEWSKTYLSNLAGMIATVIAVVMWVTSMPRFRRKMFEVFFYTHHLYIIFIIFYVLHVGSAYFCMILPGIFLFVVDRYLRFLQSRKRARLLSARLLPCDVVELNFSKSAELYYNPTSMLFINVPSISRLQWHPFTVTSNCNMEQDKLSIVCKSEGSWTQRLYQEISSSIDRLEVSIEGPYGPNSADFLRHETLVMVCGGSGISPFISIIREIIFQSTKPDYQAPNVHLICAFKNFSDLSMLDLLLPISGTPAEISKLQLQIEVYVTREIEQPKTDTQKLLQSLWFKANPLDSPISTALGPKTWLWLGAIIASSFVMFLLLLGIITRYYIYPIERNGTEVYHYSYKCLWDMFLVCACIFIASSAVFLWCKKENDHREEKQIQNVEVPTPTTSPGSWLYSADRELESLPNQSLVEATKVHFGERPNLKKILFGLKGSDVGVLVCGPKKMRYEVAKICASGLADNLHFESISFNW